MAQILKQITTFSGGISPNTKSGLPGSGIFERHLDIYPDADSVTLFPTPLLNSSTVVTDLVKWIVGSEPWSSVLFGYGDTGNLYSGDGSSWTLRRDGATIDHSSTGQGLIAFSDYIYYATSSTIGRGGLLSGGVGSLTYDDNFLHTDGFDIDNTQALTGNTYTTPTSISESSTDKLVFIPTHDPIVSLELFFGTKGTGNVTVTIHDADNNVVASLTVANASLPASGSYVFTFSTPWRPILGNTYHFHVTSTVADATVVTGTSNDLSTVEYNLYFGILLDNTEFHPMIQHTNGTTGTVVIGNNDYMAVLVPGVSYSPNEIRIEPGYSIRGWTREDEFIVAYAQKGTIDTNEEGKLYYWDGISPYYNYSKPCTSGMPQAMINSKNRSFSVLGGAGNFALDTAPFRILQPAPQLARHNSVNIYPGGISVWRNRTVMGISSPDDDTFEAGIYVFGNQSDRAVSYTAVSTEVITYGFSITTGTHDTNVVMGAVYGSGDSFYFAWKDSTTYGIDKVDIDNNPAATASYESLIIDEGSLNGQLGSMPNKKKEALTLVISCVALPVGVTITPKYKIDREASWNYGVAEQIGVAGDRFIAFPINKRYYEIQLGFDITATVNYPTILSMGLLYDALEKERMEGMNV